MIEYIGFESGRKLLQCLKIKIPEIHFVADAMRDHLAGNFVRLTERNALVESIGVNPYC